MLCKMLVTYILLGHLLKFLCGLKILYELSHDLTESECIELAVKKYLEGNYIRFILSNKNNSVDDASSENDFYILQRLQKNLEWSVDVQNVKEKVIESSEILWSKISMYIISFKQSDEIEIVLQILKKSLSWNPRAKFLIISRNYFKHNSKTANIIFAILSNHKVINVVIMLANYKSFSFFTWDPFENGNCGNSVNSLALIGSCTKENSEINTSWHRNEYYGRFKNCRATAGTLNLGEFEFHMNHYKSYPEFRYLEIKLIDIIAEFSNITISHREIMVTSPGNIQDNGSMTGGFHYLENDTVNLLIGGYALTPKRYMHFDTSIPYIYDSLIWCVPYYRVFTKFQEMFHIIRPTAWILLFCIYLLVAILMWWTSCHTQKEYPSYGDVRNILLYEFTIALAMSLNKLPRTFQMRYLVMIFVIFSYYIVIGYQTYLASILTDDSNVQKYGSQDDIYKHNLKTYFRPNSVRYFAEDKLVLQRYIDCINFLKCVDFVARRKDSAICGSRIRINYIFNDFVSKTEGPLLYCFKENIVNYPLSIIMQKGFPLYGRINKAVRILRETGIIMKMQSDSLKPNKRQIGDFEVAESRTLKLLNLLPVFVMFMGGNVVAICVFSLELAMRRVSFNHFNK